MIERFESLRVHHPLTLALGDGPNDVSMLEHVDQAVVIRGSHDLKVSPDQPALYRSEATGPAGWAEGLDYWWGTMATQGGTPMSDFHQNGIITDFHNQTQRPVKELEAGNTFLDNPGERPFIPSCNRVKAAIPDLPARLAEAVEQNNASGR